MRKLSPRRRPSLRRVLIALGTSITVIAGVLYAGTALLDIPPPHTLAGLLSTAPSRQGGQLPSRPIPAATNHTSLEKHSEPWPVDVPWQGKPIGFAEFLNRTHTNALLVLREGKSSGEWYRDGIGDTTPLSSWSVAKSIVSLLAGQAIGDGKLREDDRLVDILPHLRTGGPYDMITVRQLLDMTAGVDVPESYRQYYPLTGTARMYLTRDLSEFAASHQDLEFTPGTQGAYRSVNTELLGQIVATVQGKPLAELLARDIWDPIGAQDPATWNLDKPGGREKAFCCLNATARDYAKIGQLLLDNGQANGRQVIPRDWVTRIATPAPDQVGSWGYSAQWWHPSGGDGGDYSALGVYGQYIYVNPTTRTVIVKLSDHGTEQDEQETFEVLRAIARTS